LTNFNETNIKLKAFSLLSLSGKEFFAKVNQFLRFKNRKTRISKIGNSKISTATRLKTSRISKTSRKASKTTEKNENIFPTTSTNNNAGNLRTPRAEKMANNNTEPMDATSRNFKRTVLQRDAKENISYTPDAHGFIRPPPRNTARRQHARSSSQPEISTSNGCDFGRLLNISDEIMSIPGMDETMRLLDQLLADLKAATPLQRLRILFDYGIKDLPPPTCG
jgi:hypothetical protein